MSSRRRPDPSPVKSVLTHTSLSVGVFGAALGLGGALVHVSGDSEGGGPVETIALFRPLDSDPPALKARLDPSQPVVVRAASVRVSDGEPNLGVPDPDQAYANAPTQRSTAQGAGQSVIKINGVPVGEGQSFSDARGSVSLPKAPLPGLHRGGLPQISQDGRRPVDAYARPFSNPAGKPVVSVIVGGLGINYRRSLAVIDQLPPEVTLSFTPDARGLNRLVSRARAAGHEVLIEAPMEPYEAGRAKPYSHRMNADATSDQNIARLNHILSTTTGYFGVVNHQGARFAATDGAFGPVAAALRDRGLAFVDDGTIARTPLAKTAAAEGAPVTAADIVIDAEADADSISANLLALETKALANGEALGAAFAFPLTVDLLSDWADGLEAKGI
ncbi:MAG: divergent polysaccharide deacetylase family protein, partial [Pseudomonadota bacterium]